MYIHKRSNTYIYRRRIPRELQQTINITEFKRALVRDLKSSQLIANKYDLIFSQLRAYIKLNLDISSLIKELDLSISDKPIIKTRINHDTYGEFLKSKEGIASSSYREYTQQLELFKVILPKSFRDLSYSHVDDVKQVLLKLPKRNIQKYRNMSLNQVIKSKVKTKDIISTKSQNEYLKTLRALFKFAKERNHTNILIEIKLFKNKTSSRNQREALNTQERDVLYNDVKMVDMSKILYYSGMRLSEVYKCSIKLVDGVKCFDLKDINHELKTESSYRVIPIHGTIINNIDEMLGNAVSIKGERYTRMASKHFESKTKTLYSLRHSFATELASKGIESHVISELLGHTHSSMTMGRYVKGLSIEVLRDAVNSL